MVNWDDAHHSLHVAPLTDACAPLHALSDCSAVFHFAAPLTDLRVPLHAPSNGSAVFHFVAPLTDMRAHLHALSDRAAVSHFVALLIGVHAIYIFLLLTYAFSHSRETLILPLLLAVIAPALVIAMIQTRPDTNWKLVVVEKVCPKDVAIMILWCEYL